MFSDKNNEQDHGDHYQSPFDFDLDFDFLDTLTFCDTSVLIALRFL